jgi:hypothetical protein
MTIDEVKQAAKDLLAATDYSQLPDVKLANKAEFDLYRTAIRSLIINPYEMTQMPPPPEPVWTEGA